MIPILPFLAAYSYVVTIVTYTDSKTIPTTPGSVPPPLLLLLLLLPPLHSSGQAHGLVNVNF